MRANEACAYSAGGRARQTLIKAVLALMVAFALSLAATARAEAECTRSSVCFTDAEWQNAAADDFSNKAAWFRATSRQNFIYAKEWYDRATFAFHAGQADYARAAKNTADYYSKASVADAKAADSYAAQAAFTRAAADNSERRGIFILTSELKRCGEETDPNSVPACATGKSCVDDHHPRDPSWVTVCDRQYVSVCDADRDGHKTYARIWQQFNDVWTITDYDSYGRTTTRNGVKQFCYHERIPAFGAGLYAVCVQEEGCGPWRSSILDENGRAARQYLG